MVILEQYLWKGELAMPTKITALTREQRLKIMATLTADQVQALGEFTRFTILSRFHTRHYLHNTDWVFQGVQVDPWYHMAHAHRGTNLYCDCGRRLKNQFILKSRRTGQVLMLGSAHFAQHAAIPHQVVREIQQGLNAINLYVDRVLVAYQRGQRFPHALYERVVQQHGFAGRKQSVFYQRCNLFDQVDLPLLADDVARLRRLLRPDKPRLSPAEKQERYQATLTNWEELAQLVRAFQLQLSQLNLTPQDRHRIMTNARNYALHRRQNKYYCLDRNEAATLTLTKLRAQVELKLQEISFYAQITVQHPDQQVEKLHQRAVQMLNKHGRKLVRSRQFGVAEAQALLE